MGEIERLVAVVPPPPGRRSSIDWTRVSAELSVELPADYVELIEVYGSGQFDEYLYLLEPFCFNPYYDLVREYRDRRDALRMLFGEGGPRPAELTDPENQVIPWASTDNGEYLYWLVRPGVDPNDWTVLVNEGRGWEWEHFDMGYAQFLRASLVGEVHSEILSPDFYPADVHVFHPMTAPAGH